MSRSTATAIGFVAVLLWALLALFTVGTAPTPPFLLNAICFAIGGTLGLIWTAASGGLGQLRAVPLRVYLKGPWVKVELALAKGRAHHEKRDQIKKKIQEREIQQALRRRGS